MRGNGSEGKGICSAEALASFKMSDPPKLAYDRSLAAGRAETKDLRSLLAQPRENAELPLQ